MMHMTTVGVTEALYGSLMRIQRGWSYRYQYRVIVGGDEKMWRCKSTKADGEILK